MQSGLLKSGSRLLGFLSALAVAELLLTAALWRLGWNGTISAVIRLIIGVGCLLLLGAAIYLLVRWRRTSFRFSLRVLFLVTTAICILIGTFGAHYVRIAQDRALVRTLRSLGVQEIYLYDIEAKKPSTIDAHVDALESYLQKAPLTQQLFSIRFDSDAAVRGGLPLLQRLPRVTAIYLSGNTSDVALSAVDDQLEMLPQIRSIVVKDANITDQGLAGIARDQQIKELSLGEHHITDKGLTHIGKMTNLESLVLSDPGLGARNPTRITAEGLAQLQGLSKLNRLLVLGLHVGDDGLEQISHLSAVEYLALVEVQITDSGVHWLQSMPNLQTLVIKDCPITDDGLTQLSVLKNLKTVILSLTQVSEAGVESFRAARPDCKVSASK